MGALRYQGETISRNRVARLMSEQGIHGVPQRRRRRRKLSGYRPDRVCNHLKRYFAGLEPNTKSVTDITCVRTAEAWLYLCVVIDLYSKRVVGWSMSRTQNRELVLKAALMVLYQRESCTEPVILHSDRGTQFTSAEYQTFFKDHQTIRPSDHQIIRSMSAVGHCADNAAAEGLFGMLKRERAHRRRYQTVAEARTDVFDYIERFYNPRIDQRIKAEDRAGIR